MSNDVAEWRKKKQELEQQAERLQKQVEAGKDTVQRLVGQVMLLDAMIKESIAPKKKETPPDSKKKEATSKEEKKK